MVVGVPPPPAVRESQRRQGALAAHRPPHSLTRSGGDRLAELRSSLLGPTADQALRETDERLDWYWKQLQPFYVRHEDEPGGQSGLMPTADAAGCGDRVRVPTW
jgi:hypothetical protein